MVVDEDLQPIAKDGMVFAKESLCRRQPFANDFDDVPLGDDVRIVVREFSAPGPEHSVLADERRPDYGRRMHVLVHPLRDIVQVDNTVAVIRAFGSGSDPTAPPGAHR